MAPLLGCGACAAGGQAAIFLTLLHSPTQHARTPLDARVTSPAGRSPIS